MRRPLGSFFISLIFVWAALAVAASIYSKQHPDLPWLLSAALPALACEAIFFLASLFPETRQRFGRLRVRSQSLLLWLSALLPYLIFSLATGTFQRNAFYLLAVLTAIISFWYSLAPRRAAYDLGFIVVAAAPQITHVFARIYMPPNGRLPVDLIGHLAWIHIGILALLVIRDWNPGPLSAWPEPREWRIGVLVFLAAIAPIVVTAVLIGDVHFVAPKAEWLPLAGEAVGVFFGIFWVVALSEELFFRGFIQRALAQTLHPAIAILLASLLFGSVHLWTSSFPNWRRAATATVLGAACGIAYRWAGSVRASMVTHSLVVVTWRLFFRA